MTKGAKHEEAAKIVDKIVFNKVSDQNAALVLSFQPATFAHVLIK